MKKLEEYETPITDSAAFQVRSRGTPMAADVVYQSITRDLERKLAMCRDALQSAIAWEHKCNNEYDDAPSKEPKAFIALIENTLKATELK